jgi:hypothetical protein
VPLQKLFAICVPLKSCSHLCVIHLNFFALHIIPLHPIFTVKSPSMWAPLSFLSTMPLPQCIGSLGPIRVAATVLAYWNASHVLRHAIVVSAAPPRAAAPGDAQLHGARPCSDSLFAWLISHQPAVLFSQNKPVTSNQPAVLFSQNKPAPAISHQPNEQAAGMRGKPVGWQLPLTGGGDDARGATSTGGVTSARRPLGRPLRVQEVAEHRTEDGVNSGNGGRRLSANSGRRAPHGGWHGELPPVRRLDSSRGSVRSSRGGTGFLGESQAWSCPRHGGA